MAENCDPSSLANAARCFEQCIPPGMQQAVANYLLCQILNSQSVLAECGGCPSTATVVVPSTGASSVKAIAHMFTAPVNGTTQVFPLLVQLDDYQNFVVQDKFGNALMGIRQDVYGAPGTTVACLFGSTTHQLIDAGFYMSGAAGADWFICQGGNLHDGYQVKTAGVGQGIQIQVASPPLTAIDPNISGVCPNSGTGYVGIIDSNYGSFYIVGLVGNPLQNGASPATGAAAGAGGGLGVGIDSNPSDLSFQITLVTGNAGLGAGTLVTVTLEAYDPILVASFPVKPVISAASATAAAEIAKVYCTGTGSTVVISAVSALTANTTYVWNVFGCR